MRTRSKLALAGLAAALLLSMAITTASAREFRLDEQRFRVTWTSLEFVEPSLGIRILCPVTLEGSFHSATLRKVVDSLIGHVTRAEVNSSACRNGTATVLRETLPWHITYGGFSGALPNITGIRVSLIRPSFRLRVLFFECLSQPARVPGTISGTREAGGAFKAERLVPDPGRYPCGEAFEGEFVGNGNVTKLNSTVRPLITLI